MELKYPQKSNGMYVLKRSDFDVIAAEVLAKYCPGNLARVRPLDIDYLLSECLYLTTKYKYLSNDQSILGMIAFADTDWHPVTAFSPMVEEIPAGTIYIDPCLLDPAQHGRCRFTKAHEGSHWILHRSYHSPCNQVFSLRQNGVTAVACRGTTIEKYSWNRNHTWTDQDWEEWQADSLGAAMLMPREPFIDAFRTAICHQGFRQFYLVKGERPAESRSVIAEVARRFDVSLRAAQIRMCHLNLIRNR